MIEYKIDLEFYNAKKARKTFMITIASYDTKLESFLQQVVNICISKYCYDMNLQHLQKIELVKEPEFISDARFYPNECTIKLCPRLFDLLPTYDVKKLSTNNDFKLIIYSLYHELCHASDSTVNPNLYTEAESTSNAWDALAILFWLEYLVEKKCHQNIGMDNSKLYEDFINVEFRCSEFNLETANPANFFYFTKCMSYLVAMILWEKTGKKYFERIKDNLLRDYIEELSGELVKLDQLKYFDTLKPLCSLQRIMMKYYKKSKDICNHGIITLLSL